MHKLTTLIGVAMMTAITVSANEPDSLYLFSYNTEPGRGLEHAISADGLTWSPLAGGHIFVSSDYGAWGSQKKMHSPSLARIGQQWVLAFGVNDKEPVFGIAVSNDLVHWKPQDYPRMASTDQCLEPTLTTTADGAIAVAFHNADGQWFQTTSRDAYHFTLPQPTTAPAPKATATIGGKPMAGSINRVAAAEAETYRAFAALTRQKAALHGENLRDASAFAFLKEHPLHATISIDPTTAKPISDKLIGIFFEDINYSADGGLYAELVQNRDFEYSAADGGREPNWGSTHSWTTSGEGTRMAILTDDPLTPNQTHYAVLNTTLKGGALVNDGFDGIAVAEGDTYVVSLFARQLSDKAQRIRVELRDGDRVIGTTTLPAPTATWQRLTGTIRATASAAAASLAVGIKGQGRVAMDIVSLFPRNTFKGRTNGMRADLAQALADLHPRFMRFPGGCVAHGDGIGNIYNWKETVGPIETRKGARNLWGYHQTRGLGYYEYVLLCEDLGCEPLPVVAAGVPCQNSSNGGGGQQGGIPMGAGMEQYVQDVLDLIEWANGDPKTSEWARMRAEAGHPKPFNLKYIGIGNEDLISETFTERYLMLIRAVKERYPDITVCGTTGPFFEGADYEQGWRLAKANAIDMVDEHYYVSPAWYVHNQDFYDRYDRSASKVYLGEYASHGPGRKSTIETALTCAMHICNLERNGDIVAMSSYAPLLAKKGHTQWNPDMIYFDNEKVYPTVDYYAQLLCGQSQGDSYLPTAIALDQDGERLRQRMAVSTVRDSATGTTYVKIVNLLPESVAAKLDVARLLATRPQPKGLRLRAHQTTPQARVVCLSGDMSSTDARPTEPQYVELLPQTDIILPANSLTVISF